MPIYKRGKTYWVDISAPSGERVRCSTGTEDKVKAQEYHDKIKHELWQVDKLEKLPERYFEEMVILVLKSAEGQSSFSDKQIYARYFMGKFKGRKISSITSGEISNSLPEYNPKTKGKLSGATKNRYLAFIMRGFSLARKMGWISNQPYIPRAREAKVRIRWIERDEAALLVNNLKHTWMKRLVSLALLTGARKSELLTLTWSHVNLQRRIAVITADNAKSGKARSIPLNDEAIAILTTIPEEGRYVFSNEGNRRKEISRPDFKQALQKSGIFDFRFHDLRHTWASWHVQSGTPLMVLKALGGWEKIEMVSKYAHLSSEHLFKYSGVVTFLTQEENNDNKVTSINSLIA